MCGIAAYTGADQGKKAAMQLDFARMQHRGPDSTKVLDLAEAGWMGFHRLRIIDTSESGDQPFVARGLQVICNGEIFNHHELREEFSSWEYQSGSDCEVILPMYAALGIEETVRRLDGEFAFMIYDGEKKTWLAGRDAMGIRPLFYGQDGAGDFYFASEMKALKDQCEVINAFPAGSYFEDGEVKKFHAHDEVAQDSEITVETALVGIKEKFELAVEKRLEADVPVGFLLSGGLDSSLVCGIAAKLLDKPLKTFSVGIEGDAIDTKYAREVAEYLGTEHTEYLFSREDLFNTLEELIVLLETWDITTIRAAMGMFLLTKFIREKTDVRVVLTGEVSDEIFGYKYTDFAPSAEEFQKEAQKRVRELYMYDVLRADRCIAGASLEARVPFSDRDFVDYVMSIPAEIKMNTYGEGKYLLRKAFEGAGYIPDAILWREKAAFSDAVGHSSVDSLKAHAEQMFSDAEFEVRRVKFPHGTPFTKESLMYREIFEKHFPGRAEVIPSFWMPNKEWEGCAVDDPSARAGNRIYYPPLLRERGMSLIARWF